MKIKKLFIFFIYSMHACKEQIKIDNNNKKCKNFLLKLVSCCLQNNNFADERESIRDNMINHENSGKFTIPSNIPDNADRRSKRN